MNTVDALNVLGKALCGDSFEVKPGLTDAETILEIAKNYEGGGSGSGGGSIPVLEVVGTIENYTATLASVKTYKEIEDSIDEGNYIFLVKFNVNSVDEGVVYKNSDLYKFDFKVVSPTDGIYLANIYGHYYSAQVEYQGIVGTLLFEKTSDDEPATVYMNNGVIIGTGA